MCTLAVLWTILGRMRGLVKKYGSYLDEAVYGANDGIITTFAVIAGASGAVLGSGTIIILGIANLVADGFSMGASSFLAIRTEADVARAHHRRAGDGHALARSVTTFFAFVVAGCLPLLPFLLPTFKADALLVSTMGACTAFFFVGGARSYVTKRSFVSSGLEMLGVGGVAALLAYMIGALLRSLIPTLV